MLDWIDRRCRQATDISDDVFGHLSIILFGDPAHILDISSISAIKVSLKLILLLNSVDIIPLHSKNSS